MATAMAQLCGQLCGTCNLPYNRFSARPQLIPCARMACQVKIHWQCHLPKMDSKEFLVTKRYGKFSFVCPKCTTTGPPREEPLILCFINLLDDNILEEIVADFERACWRAVEDVFPNVSILGCGFHFTQAVFRNLKRFGLVPLYQSNLSVRYFLRCCMCLHLIQHQTISDVFDRLLEEAKKLNLEPSHQANLDKFLKYMDSQ